MHVLLEDLFNELAVSATFDMSTADEELLKPRVDCLRWDVGLSTFLAASMSEASLSLCGRRSRERVDCLLDTLVGTFSSLMVLCAASAEDGEEPRNS